MPNAKTSPRAEKRALREKMRSLGLGCREIAVEFARRYNLRPRTAWREALGWSLTEAAKRINTYAGQTGLDPDGVSPMSGSHLCDVEAWPGEGAKPTGRKPRPYVFALLAAVYGASVVDLIDLADREHLPPGDLLVLEKYSQNPPVAVNHPPGPQPHPPPQPSHALALPAAGDGGRAALELRSLAAHLASTSATAALPSPGVAYRGMQEPDLWASWIEREVLMTAHEGSDHAERAEQRDIGDATLEQLRADVARLSRQYMTSEPFTLLLEMRRVRSRMHNALDRRLWPRDQAELYFLLACLNGLMAIAVKALGYPEAAEELVRAGWAYATTIDHRPLMARLRMESADVAYLYNRPRQARDLAESALRYLPAGPNAALTHLIYGQAAASLGDAAAARSAITAASEARDREHTDELLEIGGEFNFSRASQHFYAGAIVVQIPGGEPGAITELQRATELYAAGPEPGEDHSSQCRMLAHADLCTAQLQAGHLDAALEAIEPVMTLPPGLRTEYMSKRLTAVRAELARPRYQGSPQARNLDERIEEFGRDTIVGVLHDLPAVPG